MHRNSDVGMGGLIMKLVMTPFNVFCLFVNGTFTIFAVGYIVRNIYYNVKEFIDKGRTE